jgi:hypothetical protein
LGTFIHHRWLIHGLGFENWATDGGRIGHEPVWQVSQQEGPNVRVLPEQNEKRGCRQGRVDSGMVDHRGGKLGFLIQTGLVAPKTHKMYDRMEKLS